VTTFDAATRGEFSLHSQDAVGAVRLEMDLGDQVGQHRVTHRPFRWGLAALLVEPQLGDPTDPASHLNCRSFRGVHFDPGLSRPNHRTRRTLSDSALRLSTEAAGGQSAKWVARRRLVR
jgi:hypothetical protein